MNMYDANTHELVSLVGRTITAAEYSDPNEHNEWSDHGEYTLTLDDGRKVIFDSIGFDASDVLMRIEVKL